MPDDSLLHSANLSLRAGLAALLLLVAALLWRDHRPAVAARLGAACAVGAAAYALLLVPAWSSPPGTATPLWLAPLAALTTGNAVVFWLLVRALFDDDFQLQRWHAVAWALLAGAGLISCYALPPPRPGADILAGLILLATLGWALLAVGQSLASWRADLVEGRRRLRVFIVAAGASYTLLNTGTKLLLHHDAGLVAMAGLLDALALATVVLPIVWHLLGGTRNELFVVAAAPALVARRADAPAPTDASSDAPSAGRPAEAVAEPVDAARVAALQRLMVVDRLYREEGLTIGALAERLDLAEHKLRRLINQQLGHRNFNQYLNGYRLADAKAALADPARADEPVLAIAMEAGFQSLGPFNRAFKADTGLTPSEYRRRAGSATGEGEAPEALTGA